MQGNFLEVDPTMNNFYNLKILITTLVFFTFLEVIGQKLNINGQLISSEQGTPIPFATVQIDKTQLFASSDAVGNFTFTNLNPGEYTLKVSVIGFKPYEEKVELKETNQNLKITLSTTIITLASVTVSPTKSITQSESINGIDRILRPVNTAQDLLRLVPGLFIAQHAGGGKAEQIFLRGFDCDHGTDFYITVDGMPVNMVSHAHGQGYADFHFVIPETVDNLKVYKGPYTTKFGDFATSGTGEFTTKNALSQNYVKAEYGIFDTYRALAMIKLLDKKKFLSDNKENAYIAGEYVFTNSYFDNPQKFNRFNLFSKYTALLGNRNYLSLSASTFYADWNASGQIPARAVDSGFIGRFGSIDPSEGGQTHRTNVNAILTTTLNNNASIKNQFYFVDYYFNLYSNFTLFLNDPIHGDQINQTDKRSIFGYNGTYQKDVTIGGRTLHTTFGIGTRNDVTNISLKHSEKRTILDTIVSGKVMQNNTSTYMDLTYDLSPKFSINGGIRLDYFQFQFNNTKENVIRDTSSGKTQILRPSPKLNFYYAPNNQLQFFVKSGIGFHSNDARAVVYNHITNRLPKAYGSEVGSEFKPFKRMIVNVALWQLYLESELIYGGDAGTYETSTPTRRYGYDLSIRYQIIGNLFADIDFNYAHGRLVGVEKGHDYISLAPNHTSIGGLTYKQEQGINASLRYRFIDSRPADDSNRVVAKGYFLLDAVVSYRYKNMDIGLTAENLLNVKWNQAQFDTQSRLRNEPKDGVDELHYTPGTPFFLKGHIGVRF